MFSAEQGAVVTQSKVPTSIPKGKTLYTAGIRWTLAKLRKQHPELLSSAAMLAIERYGREWLEKNAKTFDDWDWNRTVEIEKRKLEYITGPDKPSTLSYQLFDPDKDWKESDWKDIDAFIKSIPNLGKLFPAGWFADKRGYFKGFAAMIAIDQFLAPAQRKRIVLKEATGLTQTGFSGFGDEERIMDWETSKLVAVARSQRGKILEFALRLYKNFELRGPSDWYDFQEVFGQKDLSKLPPNTISYVMMYEEPVGVDPQMARTVQFWSELFNQPALQSVLNAVISLYPSHTTQLADWTDQGFIDYFKEEEDNYTTYVWLINYILNDFKIKVDGQRRILVKYIRQRRMESVVKMKEKDNEWMDFLKAVIGMVGMALAIYGIGTAITAVAGTMGAGSGASTGFTLGTGQAASMIQANPAFMAPLTSVEGAGALTGATLTSTFGSQASVLSVNAALAAQASQAGSLTSLLVNVGKLTEKGVGLYQKIQKFEIADQQRRLVMQQMQQQTGQLRYADPKQFYEPFLQLTTEEYQALAPAEKAVYDEYKKRYAQATGQYSMTGMFGGSTGIILLLGAGAIAYILFGKEGK